MGTGYWVLGTGKENISSFFFSSCFLVHILDPKGGSVEPLPLVTGLISMEIIIISVSLTSFGFRDKLTAST